VVSNRIKKRMTDVVAGYTIKAMLLDGLSPDPDHNFVSDIVAFEISTTGYARVTVSSPSSSQDDANDWAKLDCVDVDFGTPGVIGGVDVTHIAFYRHVTNDADSEIISVHDYVASLNGGPHVVVIDANGILTQE
jgi:hypothetical protein